ncbi:hypothetical protein PHISP_04155 [Aspergillus sp. HF37]|nr:hypothetical protein PHISP_04155 [Aspergillus sp. HF37]
MSFTRKVYAEVPRQLFRLINRNSINLRVHQEGRKSWDIQEERGNVFPIAHWGPKFNGTQFANRAHKLAVIEAKRLEGPNGASLFPLGAKLRRAVDEFGGSKTQVWALRQGRSDHYRNVSGSTS